MSLFYPSPTFKQLEYWPAKGVIEISVDERGYILLSSASRQSPILPVSGMVEPPQGTDSSPASLGGCDDLREWEMPPSGLLGRIGCCLDISYNSIHKFFTPRTTLRNFIDAFFTHKTRVKIDRVSIAGRFV